MVKDDNKGSKTPKKGKDNVDKETPPKVPDKGKENVVKAIPPKVPDKGKENVVKATSPKVPDKGKEKAASAKVREKGTVNALEKAKLAKKSESSDKSSIVKDPKKEKENADKTIPGKVPEKGKENVIVKTKTPEKIKTKEPIKALPKKRPAFLDQAPVKVSPVIKFGRYAFLLLGIFYGVTKNKYYSSKEKRYQEHKAILEKAKQEALDIEKNIDDSR